jgi:lipopolysaccharide export system protein LptC
MLTTFVIVMEILLFILATVVVWLNFDQEKAKTEHYLQIVTNKEWAQYKKNERDKLRWDTEKEIHKRWKDTFGK